MHELSGDYTYEEYCQEILAYMQLQNESFDFGEGEMIMEEGGEHAMYKFSILHWLNSDYYDYIQSEPVVNEVGDEFVLAQKKYESKLRNNKYHRNRNIINKKKLKCRNVMKWYSAPYYIVKDKSGVEYLKITGRGKRSKHLKKRSSKVMRNQKYKNEYFSKGSKYKKTFDYWWGMY